MMFTSVNCTVFDIPLTWDRTRFEASRFKCRQARKLVETSINAQFEKQLKNAFFQKLDIEKDIIASQERLLNHEKKVRVLDNLTEVASESLTDYFDKRMENVRTIIQEHCNAIQQILNEENEHWKEIHAVIDQNLITSDDIHSRNNVEPITQENPLPDIRTIEEEDEEENTSKLLNNKTLTPILTQMIRKSRLQSKHLSTIEPDIPSSIENLTQSKEERFSVIIPLNSARRTLPVIDTTFVVKVEETKNNEPNKSYQEEVVPIKNLPTIEVDTSPSYSQPKAPARLYFSPTLLQDDEEEEQQPPPEPIQKVLSTIDQNQTSKTKEFLPKIISRRFGQTFVLDNTETEVTDESHDTENLRPKISDEIPFIMINPNPSLPLQNQLDESHHSEVHDHQKSIVYSKRRTRAVIQIESEPIHMTRHATKALQQPKEIDTNKQQTRKRKQSMSNDKANTTSLRKKKAGPVEKKVPTKTKTKKRKIKEVPIRELSPLPIIDRSKHYRTHFSTRSHRFNNITLSTTAMINDTINDDNNQTKYSSSRLRTKSMGRNRTYHNHDDDGDDQSFLKTRPTVNKTQAKKRAKSMMNTRNRKK